MNENVKDVRPLRDDRIFFLPGDLVTMRKGVPNAPVMVVKGKETKMVRADSNGERDPKEYFKGIRCFWFSTTGELQEAVFNTKDLKKL